LKFSRSGAFHVVALGVELLLLMLADDVLRSSQGSSAQVTVYHCTRTQVTITKLKEKKRKI
jgi:hypothetical protein